MKFVSAQSRPEEKLRAAGYQQGTTVVATCFFYKTDILFTIVANGKHLSNARLYDRTSL